MDDKEMKEVIIEKEIITYQQVLDGYQVENDPFKIGEYTINESIRNTFLDNPYLKDYSKCMIFFNRVDGVIGGRQMYFPTKLKVGDKVIMAQSGSSLQTVPEYRKYAIGMDMIDYPIKKKDFPVIIYGGVAKTAIPIYKALRFVFLEIPEYWQPRKSRFFFQRIGLRGAFLLFVAGLTNYLFKLALMLVKSTSLNINKRYSVNRLPKVPSWVDDVIKNDNHKYAEIHDSKWMQWTLDNNFFNREGDIQSFYEVRDGQEILGFFMTKERVSSFPDYNIDKVVFGSMYEWGTFDEKKLSEEAITRLAMTTFSDNVDIVTISSLDKETSRFLKKMLSFRHGNTTIIVKDLTKSYKDMKDINLWRLRSGYCDCPFY